MRIQEIFSKIIGSEIGNEEAVTVDLREATQSFQTLFDIFQSNFDIF